MLALEQRTPVIVEPANAALPQHVAILEKPVNLVLVSAELQQHVLVRQQPLFVMLQIIYVNVLQLLQLVVVEKNVLVGHVSVSHAFVYSNMCLDIENSF